MMRLQSMWVSNGARQDTSQAMESFTFCSFSISPKQEYNKKQRSFTKLNSLAFILKPLGFVGSNTLYKVEAIGPFIYIWVWVQKNGVVG